PHAVIAADPTELNAQHVAGAIPPSTYLIAEQAVHGSAMQAASRRFLFGLGLFPDPLFKKFGFAFGFYMASTLAIALSTGTLMSIGRYILVLFPMYLLLASVSNIYFKYAWVSISLLFFALYTLLFANYYWAG
ncbi:MAG: hypothetical protein HYV77_02365, partial [Candidatus Wildermuthbacteria bacterium]|nr:hypothetical protein [Candidatus Wildermuthbacteria bacterium]